jgi:hypothetical protein
VFEPVLTVHDWWDGPRAGVAHFRGQPCLYISSWDDAADEWSSTFALVPLDDSELALAVEDYDIWRRWRLAYDAGEVPLDSGPALPRDLARAEELKRLVQPLFTRSAGAIAYAKPAFRKRSEPALIADPYNLEVAWQVVG